MGLGSLQGRAYTDPDAPEPPGTCDRCGMRFMLKDLHWDYQWSGNHLQNLRLLVCEKDRDIPAEYLRPLILGPDPLPVQDPRPGFYYAQEGSPPNPNFDSVLIQLVD